MGADIVFVFTIVHFSSVSLHAEQETFYVNSANLATKEIINYW